MSVFIGYPSFMAYQMMKGKKDNNDGFPSIPGMIARYSALGLTNEQMKENPVWVDKTGNGHDLQMKNFLWGEMSGVGGYKLNWGDSNIWRNYITQGTFGTGEVTDNTIHITSAKTNNALFETRASLKSVECKVLIKGLTDDIYLRYGVFNDGKELWTEIKNDGIYTLPSYDYDSRYNMKWKVMSQTYPIDCNITIEQIPEYEGYLITDGVDDKAVSKQFKFGENFTVILDFKFPVKKISYCGFDLSSKVRIQNLQGSGVYVVLKGNKTLIPSNVVRAVTSEGKVYDENWNEYNIVPGNISSNYTMVNLGFDGSNQFAESATKLAGIYSSTLSKEDCIKAYNYLQTLKAK